MKKITIATERDIPAYYTGTAYLTNDKWYRLTLLNGELHSFNDKPAQMNRTGDIRVWRKNDKLHRVGGYAFMSKSIRSYYLDNMRFDLNEEHDYWKNCWWYYRTPENEQMLMAKLLAGNVDVG